MKPVAIVGGLIAAGAVYLMLRKKAVAADGSVDESLLGYTIAGLGDAQKKTQESVTKLAETIGQIGNNINVGSGIDYEALRSIFGSEQPAGQLTRTQAYDAYIAAGCNAPIGAGGTSVGQRSACDGLKHLIDTLP